MTAISPRSEPDWRRRFLAPRTSDLRLALGRPARAAVLSNESGTLQAWSWDLETGARWRVTDAALGVERIEITPDGSHVVWWCDETGDESGRWMATPFEGGPTLPLHADLPVGWVNGISLAGAGIAVGVVTEDEGFRVLVSLGGAAPREIYRHPVPAGQSDEYVRFRIALSADAGLLATRTAEGGDIEITALRAFDASSGEPLGDLADVGTRLAPVAWSPLPGDPRLLFLHERAGWERPGIWDLATGERNDLDPGLPGALVPFAWYPDGQAVLVRQDHEGQQRLHRLDLASGVSELLIDLGTVDEAVVRPDGDVWALTHSSANPPRWVNAAGVEVLAADGSVEPAGHRAATFFFENPSAERIQAFVIQPQGEPPFPTILSIHGGPNYHHTDGYEPMLQAYADHGYAVLLVNYRGSTGYGTAFRDAIRGHLGTLESEDVNAALDRAIADGMADPDRVFLEGWSWGGYLAALNAGTHPSRWRAVVAGIPVGDYVASHYEAAPELRAWDVAIFGDPMQEAERYRVGNPITYVDRVEAPILLIAGERDSRCPLGQVMTYAVALKALGKPVEVHLYEGGHHAHALEEQIRHVELAMEFFGRHR